MVGFNLHIILTHDAPSRIYIPLWSDSIRDEFLNVFVREKDLHSIMVGFNRETNPLIADISEIYIPLWSDSILHRRTTSGRKTYLHSIMVGFNLFCAMRKYVYVINLHSIMVGFNRSRPRYLVPSQYHLHSIMVGFNLKHFTTPKPLFLIYIPLWSDSILVDRPKSDAR